MPRGGDQRAAGSRRPTAGATGDRAGGTGGAGPVAEGGPGPDATPDVRGDVPGDTGGDGDQPINGVAPGRATVAHWAVAGADSLELVNACTGSPWVEPVEGAPACPTCGDAARRVNEGMRV